MIKVDNQTLKATSYHEAGHALLAFTYGSVEYIQMYLELDSEKNKFWGVTHLRLPNNSEKKIRIYLAGTLSETLFGFLSPQLGHTSDIVKIAEILKENSDLDLTKIVVDTCHEISNPVNQSNIKCLAEFILLKCQLFGFFSRKEVKISGLSIEFLFVWSSVYTNIRNFFRNNIDIFLNSVIVLKGIVG